MVKKPSRPATSREKLNSTYFLIFTMCSLSKSTRLFPEQNNGLRFGPEFPYRDSFHFLYTPNVPVHIKTTLTKILMDMCMR